MKKLIALLLLIPSASFAAGVRSFQVPAVKGLQVAAQLGKRPSETRVPLAKTLDTFRTGPVLVTLGGKKHHLAVQTVRTGGWVACLVPEGKNHHEIEASFLFSSLRRAKTTAKFNGREYRITLDEAAQDSDRHTLSFTPTDGGAGAEHATLAALKEAVWTKAVPLPSIGPDWRMIFQVDLWRGAGMRTISFLRKAENGVSFYDLRAESVETDAERKKMVGGLSFGLKVDSKDGSLVVRLVK